MNKTTELTQEQMTYLGKTTENGITDRVKKLNKQMHDAQYGVSLHRAHCFTEVYKNNESEPVAIRRALAVAKTMDTLPLLYNEGELIVGQQSDRIKAKPLAPEVYTGWIEDEGGLASLATRQFNPCISTPQEQKEFEDEVVPYWYDKTLLSKFRKICPEDVQDKICGTMFGEPCFLTAVYGSHTHIDWAGIIEKGTNAYRSYAQKKLDSLDFSELGNCQKRNFYRASIIVLDAIERFALRWSAKMQKMADAESNPEKKAEFEKIAKICAKVPMQPAETLHEGLQAMWLVECVLFNDSTGPLIAFGHMDQYLNPLYENDLKSGSINETEAMELLQCFFIKCNNDYMFVDNESAQHLAGNASFQNIVLGGVDKYGNDAVSKMSYLIIDSFIQAHILQPALCVRINDVTPETFKEKILDLIGAGMGFPSIFNDKVGIHCAERYGNTVEDSNDYTCSGCMEIGKPASYWWTPGQWVNLAAAADLAMTDGIKREGLAGRKAGERISVSTGDPRNFKTFEEYKDAVKAHIKSQMDMIYIADQFIMETYQDYPLITQSIFTNSCLERGLPYHSGGIFSSSAPGYASVGMADIADAAAAVKKLVFDEKRITMDELCKALDANFEGYEDIRQMCLAAPKYGNDDDYVDDLEHEFVDYYADVALSKLGVLALRDPDQETAHLRHRGGPSMSPVSGNVPYGLGVGALASGRKALEPLGDSAGAYMGMDQNGPTAAISSYGKVDWFKLHGGIVNFYIEKQNLEDPVSRKKVISLIDGAMDAKMAHIQFNVQDKAILKDAQENPEEYPTLIVRVAGYSAYFVELDESVQETIIDRTQHNIA